MASDYIVLYHMAATVVCFYHIGDAVSDTGICTMNARPRNMIRVVTSFLASPISKLQVMRLSLHRIRCLLCRPINSPFHRIQCWSWGRRLKRLNPSFQSRCSFCKRRCYCSSVISYGSSRRWAAGGRGFGEARIKRRGCITKRR